MQGEEVRSTVLERLLLSKDFGFWNNKNVSRFISEAQKHGVCSSNPNNTDLEISFRMILSKKLDSVDLRRSEVSTIYGLIEFACQVAKESTILANSTNMTGDFFFGDNCRRIPFLLIEDLLEGQTIAHVGSMWKDVVEPLTNHLVDEIIFSRGSTILLRVCNGVLRMLSQSVNTELCGRILLFLAHVFPISERSAVNLLGKYNSNNTTRFDDFNVWVEMDEERRRSILREHKGLFGCDNSVEIKHHNALDLTYIEYTDFWRLQSLLSTDSKNLHAHELRSGMQRVLDILETWGHSSNIKKGSVNVRTKTNFSETSAVGQKYLTDSQLFHLELADGQFRQQICTQILIACQHLRFVDEGGLDTKTARLLLVKEIESRAFCILENTHDGGRLAATVRQTLYRENFWREWKAQSCPSFSRIKVKDYARYQWGKKWNERSARMDVGDESSLLERVPPSWWVNSDKKSMYRMSGSCAWSRPVDEVKAVAQWLIRDIPTYEQHIEAFEDADDPEAGIEDEYHPKHDSLYCWRARRLMAESHLNIFASMRDGNIKRGIEAINTSTDSHLESPVCVMLSPVILHKVKAPLVSVPMECIPDKVMGVDHEIIERHSTQEGVVLGDKRQRRIEEGGVEEEEYVEGVIERENNLESQREEKSKTEESAKSSENKPPTRKKRKRN